MAVTRKIVGDFGFHHKVHSSSVFCSDLMNYLESVEDSDGGVGSSGGPGAPAANGSAPILLNRSPVNSK